MVYQAKVIIHNILNLRRVLSNISYLISSIFMEEFLNIIKNRLSAWYYPLEEIRNILAKTTKFLKCHFNK